MAQLPVIILHGWSDESTSFQPLAKYLEDNGIITTPIYLGDYLSMHDEVTLPDLGRAMQHAIAAAGIPQDRHSFDLIVHSTGALVGREYLRQICRDSEGKPDATLTPIRRFVFLAPANFGSPLAHIGKSMIGRLFKGWKWNRPLETGKQVLNALELASPYSSQLALDDLFDPEFPIFSPANTLATVMVGTVSYPERFKKLVHENGSDGTVRVSTANLNAAHVKVRFTDPSQPPEFKLFPQNCPEIPLAVFKRDHASITNPTDPVQKKQYQETLLQALKLEPADYDAHRDACVQITQDTYETGAAGRKFKPQYFHRYMNVVFYVHDQFGDAVDDYFVEFYQEDGDDDDEVFEKVNSEILERVHVNKVSNAWRSLYFDMDDMEKLLVEQQAEVSMSLVAAAISEMIGYANPPDLPDEGGIRVLSDTNRTFYFPNQTLIVDIEITRTQSNKVFYLQNFNG
ncbi:esterase/lipase family protein [Cerasicoccus frondis]|uniref:esterase/lipase family protein n=1 Tax=Cerasicoccus frondis TaxID=490090 RepID=UPI00285272F8|nr:hypothetical protein [Cerasicoccus frondis]